MNGMPFGDLRVPGSLHRQIIWNTRAARKKKIYKQIRKSILYQRGNKVDIRNHSTAAKRPHMNKGVLYDF